MKLIYIYDAFCPWCYAFTPVVREVLDHYGDPLDFEILSGGMLRGDGVREVGGTEEANRLRASYERITSMTGAEFGEAFFESVAGGHRRLDSEPPAVALAAFRALEGDRAALEFAHRMLRSIFLDGSDPNDPSTYIAIAEGLGLSDSSFTTELESEESADRALYDFALARQLQADGFPRLYLQTAEDYFHLIAKGYSDFERIRSIIDEIAAGE